MPQQQEIGAMYQEEVNAMVQTLLDKASSLFPRFPAKLPIGVHLDINSRCAGKAYIDLAKNHYAVHFNQRMLTRHWPEFRHTIAHEIAHIIAAYLFGEFGHGARWRLVMEKFGYPPNPYHRYPVQGCSRMKYYQYTCDCNKVFELSAIMHNRMQSNKTTYICQVCQADLRLLKERVEIS